MPVDEAILTQLDIDLRLKLIEVETERATIRRLITEATAISKEVVADPTPQNPGQTKLVMPKDRALGLEITTTRRNAIYDKLIVDKATVGL